MSVGAAQTELWLHQLGTPAPDDAGGLAPDGTGGAFLVGATGGDLGGPSSGGGDFFIARYDASGAQRWIRQGGSDGDEGIGRCAADGAGGVYICGSTTGALAGASQGGWDAFVGRYDESGNLIWLRQFGTAEDDRGHATAPDHEGGVYVVGATGEGLSFVHRDCWVARFSGAGDLLWMRQFGTAENDGAYAAARAEPEGVYVGGSTSGSLGGPRSGFVDAFLLRYDSHGELVWGRQFGSSATVEINVLTPDGSGGVLAAGLAQGTLAPTPVGGSDAFVVRYDGEGTRAWIRQFGSSRFDVAVGLAAHPSGDVFVGGFTQGDIAIPNKGGRDVYFARFSSTGAPLGAMQLGTPSEDLAGPAMFEGGLWLAGSTGGSLGGPSAGESDAWIARFVDPCDADCDGDHELTFFDFLCFQNLFAAGDPGADCDASGSLDFFDFLCFQNAFAAGCP